MDKARLEYEIKRRGKTVALTCEAVGISKSAYYRKCKGLSEFTRLEIQKIVDFLGLESPVDIFFNEKVS